MIGEHDSGPEFGSHIRVSPDVIAASEDERKALGLTPWNFLKSKITGTQGRNDVLYRYVYREAKLLAKNDMHMMAGMVMAAAMTESLMFRQAEVNDGMARGFDYSSLVGEPELADDGEPLDFDEPVAPATITPESPGVAVSQNLVDARDGEWAEWKVLREFPDSAPPDPRDVVVRFIEREQEALFQQIELFARAYSDNNSSKYEKLLYAGALPAYLIYQQETSDAMNLVAGYGERERNHLDWKMEAGTLGEDEDDPS